MPSLQQLEAYLCRYELGVAPKGHGKPLPDGTVQWGGFPVDTFVHVDALAEADGIFFLCPLCYAKAGGPRGVHGCRVFFEGRKAPDHVCRNSQGKVVRWRIAGGTGLADLRLTPSILLLSGCRWHGFIGSSGVPAGHAA